MRIWHLNCATMCPPFAAALNRRGQLVAHVLAVETNKGIVLVDTGLGTSDCESPRKRLGLPFLLAVGPAVTQAETAIEQLRRLGIRPGDVRDIVVTHLDCDHAGGLSDFPDATVHVMERERSSAFGPLPFRHRGRYRMTQFKHGPKWQDYTADGERWFGLPSVRAIEDVGGELLLVPLPGHTLGHAGVAVRQGERWLLHAGDAYFHESEVEGRRDSRGLAMFQKIVAMDWELRNENLARLVELKRAGSVEIFSSHDPEEYAAFAGSIPAVRI